jgi:hypothetical protein
MGRPLSIQQGGFAGMGLGKGDMTSEVVAAIPGMCPSALGAQGSGEPDDILPQAFRRGVEFGVPQAQQARQRRGAVMGLRRRGAPRIFVRFNGSQDPASLICSSLKNECRKGGRGLICRQP